MKDLTSHVENRLALAKHTDKIETLGKEEGNKGVANSLLTVIQKGRSKRPNTSMTMYRYSNGKGADLKKQHIPNFALKFLHEAINKFKSYYDSVERTQLPGLQTAAVQVKGWV
jgi:hypothetical protein